MNPIYISISTRNTKGNIIHSEFPLKKILLQCIFFILFTLNNFLRESSGICLYYHLECTSLYLLILLFCSLPPYTIDLKVWNWRAFWCALESKILKCMASFPLHYPNLLGGQSFRLKVNEFLAVQYRVGFSWQDGR